MLIREIALHNFKAFRGTHVLGLPAPTAEANVYLFGGENGAGKTTLVQSILLALYGVGAAGMPSMPPQGRDFRRQYGSWLSSSRNSTARDAQDDLVTVGVQIEAAGRSVTVKRSFWFRADGALEEELVELREDEGGKSELYSGDDAQDRIAIWIPRHLAELIFFDGEQVRAQLHDETGFVSGALARLLDLEPILKLVSDIRRISRDKQRSLLTSDEIVQLERLQGALETASAAYTSTQLQQSEASHEHDDLEVSLSTVQAALDERLAGTTPMTTAQLDSELTSLRARRDQLRGRFGRHLGDWYYLTLAPNLLEVLSIDVKTQQISRRSRERHKVEAEAVEDFSDALLSRLSAEISASNLERVRGLVINLRSAKVSQADQSGSESLNSALDGLRDDELSQASLAIDSARRRDDEELRYLSEDLSAIQESIAQLESLRSEIGSQGSVDRLVVRSHELQAKLTETRSSLGFIDAELATELAEVSRLQRELTHHAARSVDSEEASRWLRAAESLAAGLTYYVDERRRLALDGVSRALLSRVKDLLHKQYLVESVEIDPLTLKTRLIGRTGREVHLPSAGEHQLFAMAFAAAILDCSDSAVPMFVDTPLARLDEAHRSNVVERFWPDVGRQVFVLSTDEEVRGDLLEKLRPNVVATFLILHNDETSESRIAPGRYFEEGKNDY